MSELRLSLVLEAIDRATAPLRRVADAVKAPGAAARQAAAAANQALAGVTHSYEGVAALIGGGFEIKEIVGESDFFNRLRINAGASAERVDHLRHTLLETARAAKVAPDELTAAFKAMREGGASLDALEENLPAIATTIQRLGGQGQEVGDLYTALRKFSGLQGPEEFLKTMAIFREQLFGVAGGIERFVPQAAPLLSFYDSLGHKGVEASREIGALYAVIAQGTRSPRQALAATQSLLELIGNPSSAATLEGLGVKVYGGATDEERATNKRNNVTLPITEILSSLLTRYQINPYQFSTLLGPDFKRALKIPLGEVQAQGFSPTLNAKLAVPGDPTKFIAEATDASRGLVPSLNALRAALDQVAETALVPVLNTLAGLLDRNTGLAVGFLSAFAGVAVLGIFSGWIASIVTGAKLLPPIFAGAITVLGNFFIALRAGYGVVAAFNLVLAANPIGAVLVAIGLLAAAALLIYEKWEPIKAFFVRLWDRVKSAFSDAWNYIKPIVDLVVDASGRVGAAMDLGGPSLGAARPSIAERADLHQPGHLVRREIGGRIVIQFENTPPGMRTKEIHSDNPDVDYHVRMGVPVGAP